MRDVKSKYLTNLSLSSYHFSDTQLRTIYMGLCLPSTCSIKDVDNMSGYARHELPSRELRVTDIRVPTDTEFNIWSDKTFCLLM